MAERKTNKKSKAKKTPAKKSSRRSSTSKTSSSAANKKQREEIELYIRKKRRTKAVVLIALAVLFFLFYIFPGEKLWNVFHLCIRGLFGYLGITAPAIAVYSAAQLLREKSTYRFPIKVFFLILTVTLLASTVYCFTMNDRFLMDYSSEIINCFCEGASYHGTGVIGGILGIPVVKLFGAVGGGIITLLLFLVSLFVSFEALFVNVIDRLKDPVSERLSENREFRNRIHEQEMEIRKEQRKAAHEEHIRQELAKRKAEAENGNSPENSDMYRRLHKTPFYEPFTQPSRSSKKKKNEKSSENGNGDDSFKGIENIVPDISNKKRKKKQNADSDPYSSEQISGDSHPTADTIDIESLLRKTGTRELSGDDIIPPVFDSKNKSSQDTQRTDKKTDTELQSKKKKGKNPDLITEEFENINTGHTDNMYIKPPFTLLEPQTDESEHNISQELHSSASKLIDTLSSFGVNANITNISRGPSVTRYELQPAPGVKISKITNLADDIAMNLAATGVRIEAPIPGKNAVGIEVPNKNTTTVKMRSLVESSEFQSAKSNLTVALGMDISGKITLADLAKMPHLLIAGSTGSGKSVCINSMLVSLLYKSSPDDVKLMLIDPKVVELGVYNGIPHLLVPVVTDPRKAAGALNWAVNEMLKRYNTFAEYNVRDMQSYNRMVEKQNASVTTVDPYEPEHTSERSFEEDEMLAQAQSELVNSEKQPDAQPLKLEKMAQIVIVIDELADLMMAAPNEVEESICRLAQMARAAGMHLVIATQRPSVDVITGLIKANVPSRIAFAVKSQIDSRTILDTGGAEKLLGRGDMLFSPIGVTKPIRIQGCFVDDTEIENIISFIKSNKVVEYDNDVIEEIEKNAVQDTGASASENDDDSDPMMEAAIKCVVEAGQASTSLLQRRLKLGYARAGRLIDEMEQMGIVGPHEGSKPRKVLMSYQQWLERSMNHSEE